MAGGCLVAVVQAMVACSTAEGIGETDFHHEGYEEHEEQKVVSVLSGFVPFVFLVVRKNQAFSFSMAGGCLVAVVQAMVTSSTAEGIGGTDFHHEGHEEHKGCLSLADR